MKRRGNLKRGAHRGLVPCYRPLPHPILVGLTSLLARTRLNLFTLYDWSAARRWITMYIAIVHAVCLCLVAVFTWYADTKSGRDPTCLLQHLRPVRPPC